MANVHDKQRPQGQANLQADRNRKGADAGKNEANASFDSPEMQIREHMPVVGSCGNRVGVVDHLEGAAIKLTKNDSRDGQHHYIPVDWVESVDDEVHLKRDSMEAERDWKPSAAECQ